jgi:hypothetical protein
VTYLRNAAMHCTVFCSLMTLFVSMPLFAQINSKVLNFDEGRLEQGLMPDGCNNPFREAIKFIDFFETTIVTMAAERGASARGVENLFAVDHLRDLINEEANRRGGEESAVDRLIVTQICHYERIATKKNAGGGAKALQIFATDPALHDHLVAISTKLMTDTVALYRAQQKALREAKSQESFIVSRQAEIKKARSRGQSKARDLIY